MNNYEKMKAIYDEIDSLLSQKVTSGSPEFQAWKMKAERTLIKLYGENGLEVKEFRDTRFSLGIWTSNTPRTAFIGACASGLRSTKAIFETYLEELEEEICSGDIKAELSSNDKIEYKKVFIVHGHNGELKEAVARLLEQQGISAIILHEQTNAGSTIIEKFEKNSDVQAAICLFTADDLGKAKDSDEYKKRARQNVVLETGFFMGKIGRNKVIVIADEGIEFPSDLQGVVYTNSSSWRFEVLKELRNIGYVIDLNKL